VPSPFPYSRTIPTALPDHHSFWLCPGEKQIHVPSLLRSPKLLRCIEVFHRIIYDDSGIGTALLYMVPVKEEMESML